MVVEVVKSPERIALLLQGKRNMYEIDVMFPVIERAMELLAPLPPENLGGLLTFILDVTDVKEPAICETENP